MRENNITQTELSERTNVHQSQISRFRNGKFGTLSANLRTICEYAGIELTDKKSDGTTLIENTELMSALADVLDGTEKRDKALAKIIRSLKGLF